MKNILSSCATLTFYRNILSSSNYPSCNFLFFECRKVFRVNIQNIVPFPYCGRDSLWKLKPHKIIACVRSTFDIHHERSNPNINEIRFSPMMSKITFLRFITIKTARKVSFNIRKIYVSKSLFNFTEIYTYIWHIFNLIFFCTCFYSGLLINCKILRVKLLSHWSWEYTIWNV